MPSPGALKQRLIQDLASGDHRAAAETRRKLDQVKTRLRVQQLAARPNGPGVSVASWIGKDGLEETVVLKATPEAAAYFAQDRGDENA